MSRVFMCHHSRTYIIKKTQEEKKIDIFKKKTFLTPVLIYDYPLKTKYTSGADTYKYIMKAILLAKMACYRHLKKIYMQYILNSQK